MASEDCVASMGVDGGFDGVDGGFDGFDGSDGTESDVDG